MPTSQATGTELRRVMVVVMLGSIISLIDSTVVNLALHAISKDLNAPFDQAQWVVTAHILAIAAAIPTTGWAARRYSARKVYVWSLVFFTLSSVLCGMAENIEQLIVARILQGAAGGMILPVGHILLVKAAGPERIARVMSVVWSAVLLTRVFDPALGGAVVQTMGWRWIFFLNLPIGAVVAALAMRLLPREGGERTGRPDLAGLAVVVAGMACVTYGLARTGSAHAALTPALAYVAVGSALLTLFVVRSLRAPLPVANVRLFRDGVFTAASLTTFFLGMAVSGGHLLLPLYLLTVRHFDATTTGILLAPQGLGAALAMWVAARSVDRFGGGVTALVGCAVSIGSAVIYVYLDSSTPLVTLCVAMALHGFGVGLSSTPAMTAAYRTLSPAKINDAVPQLHVLHRIGSSAGTALGAIVLQNQLGRASSPEDVAAAYGTVYWWMLLLTIVATAPAVLLMVAEAKQRRIALHRRQDPMMV